MKTPSKFIPIAPIAYLVCKAIRGNPQAFSDDSQLSVLGGVKVARSAFKDWALACGIIAKDGRGFTLTALGNDIYDNDPYLSNATTRQQLRETLLANSAPVRDLIDDEKSMFGNLDETVSVNYEHWALTGVYSTDMQAQEKYPNCHAPVFVAYNDSSSRIRKLIKNTVFGHGEQLTIPNTTIEAGHEVLLKYLKSVDIISGERVNASHLYDVLCENLGVARAACDLIVIDFLKVYLDNVAVYKNDLYYKGTDTQALEYLLIDPNYIEVKYVKLLNNDTLSKTHEVLMDCDSSFSAYIDKPLTKTPLAVAKALVTVYFKMPNIARTTKNISDNAKALRKILKSADDPLALLKDIKHLPLKESLEELVNYPVKVVDHVRQQLSGVEAKGLEGKSGSLTLNSFIVRINKYEGSLSDTIAIMSLLAGNRPDTVWTDSDIRTVNENLPDVLHKLHTLKVSQNKKEQLTLVITTADGTKTIEGEQSIKEYLNG